MNGSVRHPEWPGVCAHRNWQAIYGGALARCGSCGLVVTAQRPEFEYTESYFTGPAGGGYDFHASLARAIDAARFGAELERLESRGLRGRVLDIGCATGSYLAHAQRRGWDVAGVELAAYARLEASRTLGVAVAASIVDLPRGARYELVTLHHVLEHHDNPMAFLRDEVAPRVGGRLLVEVPNFGSLASRVHRRTWRDLRVDQHVCHFEAGTLAALLRTAGFRNVSVYTLWEPLWSLRTAMETAALLAAAAWPWRRDGVGRAVEPAPLAQTAGEYRPPRGVKRVATDVSGAAFRPVIRTLERAGLGCRLVAEAEPA
jgi:SAM-dependent methyltransferase